MAKSFARIHRSNLINSGIIPLVFADAADYDAIALNDELAIENAAAQIENDVITVKDLTSGKEFKMIPGLSDLEKKMILAGGKINMIKGEE